MKALKVLMSIVAVAATLAITGCSKSDDNPLGDQGDPFTNVKTGWTENGNTCTYKKIVPLSTKADSYNLYYLFTIQFDSNDLCNSCKFELGCPNENIAKEVIAQLESESEYKEYMKNVSRSGRILSVDISSALKGMPKAILKPIIEQIQF